MSQYRQVTREVDLSSLLTLFEGESATFRLNDAANGSLASSLAGNAHLTFCCGFMVRSPLDDNHPVINFGDVLTYGSDGGTGYFLYQYNLVQGDSVLYSTSAFV